jgi:thymidine kinase
MQTENGGQLDIILGTMFSGKTTFILSKIAKMAELNYSILYVNIEFDNRSEQMFSTHNPFFDTHVDFVKKESIKKNVQMIKSKTLVNLDIANKDVVIIDESHFFDDLVDFVNKCLDLNKYVIVAGLIADFKGNKFGKTLDLIPICSNIERLHAYCSECAKDKKCSIAVYSKKIVKCRKSIDIGGSEKYIPVCRFHYNQIEKNILIEQEQNKKINKSKTKIEKESVDGLLGVDKTELSNTTDITDTNLLKFSN